jgi:serine/threonine protein kinase
MANRPEGTVIAGCRIRRIAGRGGMGTVYEARHIRLDRAVAIKVIAPHVSDDPAFQARFEREAKIAASLDHPHIVPVFDAGDDSGLLYIVMRWIAGTSLKSLLRNGPLSQRETASLVVQLSSALSAAHSRGLVHRDVKPANVMIEVGDAGPHAYLCDFGVAHLGGSPSLTASGDLLGTVDYAAPEQLQGDRPDPRSDQYSLACVAYEMLTGSAPFSRQSSAATVLAHIGEAPPLEMSQLSRAVRTVLARALNKAPGARFESVSRFADAFAQAIDTRTPGAATSPPEVSVSRPNRGANSARAGVSRAKRRNRPFWVGTGAVIGLLALGSISWAVLKEGGDSTSHSPKTPSAHLVRVAILTVLDRYEQAFTDHDATALGRLFTANVFRHGLRTGGCTETKGRADVVQVYEEQFHGGPTVYRFEGLSESAVHMTGTTASIATQFSINSGALRPIRFSLRHAEHRWRISRIIAPC